MKHHLETVNGSLVNKPHEHFSCNYEWKEMAEQIATFSKQVRVHRLFFCLTELLIE